MPEEYRYRIPDDGVGIERVSIDDINPTTMRTYAQVLVDARYPTQIALARALNPPNNAS